jgi:hypothetical protein
MVIQQKTKAPIPWQWTKLDPLQIEFDGDHFSLRNSSSKQSCNVGWGGTRLFFCWSSISQPNSLLPFNLV